VIRLFLSLTVYLRTETLPLSAQPNAQEYTTHKDARAKKVARARPKPHARAQILSVDQATPTFQESSGETAKHI